MDLPNILYLHSHDTGRYIQPYGHQVPMPNVQALADQGVLFRQAFCAAPTCSASRACLLTGQYGQTNGMLGLAHRGWSLRDYSHHIVHTLRGAGYQSILIGEQHISKEPDVIGYDEVMKIPTTRVETVAPLAMEVLRRPRDKPLFLSVGFFQAHRELLGPGSLRDVHYSQVPANLPDSPEVRADVAGFKASARSLDHGVGLVLNALDSSGMADDTIVIFTTDHGMPFPGAKATLYDRGLGVMLILRGPHPFRGGRVVRPRAGGDAHPPHLPPDRGGPRRGLAGLAHRPLPHDLRPPRHRAPALPAGRLAHAAAARRDAGRARRGLRRLDRARRLRAAARDPHRAPQVHPPLGRAAHAGAAQHGRRAEQGRAAAPRLGRARDPLRAALRPGLRSQRGDQPRRRPIPRGRARRPARAPGGVDARDRRPAAGGARRPA